MAVIHFLLIFNRRELRLVERKEFTNGRVAADAYAAYEERYRDNPNLEIVLVGADSIETIMETHGHYFGRPKAGRYEVVA
jgi:hypothetical protein